MDPLENILTRRSIRKYSSSPLEEAQLDNILRAAQYAPSAVNKQPWHFIVLTDPEMFQEIMSIHSSAAMLKTAKAAIIICGDEKQQHDDGFWIADCGAATQNALLAAHAQGLGACWVGLYPREKRMQAVQELLNIPVHIKPFALISLGYPAETKSQPDRYNKNKVFLNSWNNPY